MQSGKTALSTRNRLCVLLLVLLGFALGSSEFVVIGIEPELAQEFGVSLSKVGELISIFALSYAVATPILALSTGRFRRYQLLVVYSALFCLGNVMAACATTFTLLFIARVLIGSVSGALLALAVTFLPELVGEQKVSITLSIVFAAFSIAMVLSTSLSKMIADLWNWHLALIAVLVMALVICALLLAFLPKSGNVDEPTTLREQIQLLREPCILMGMAVFVFGVGSVYTLYGYISPYLEQILGMDSATTSFTLMIYGLMTLISNLLAGWLDARFGMKTLVFSFPIQAVLLCLVALSGSAMPAAVIAIMAVGISMYLLSVPIVSMFMKTARDSYPKALTLASSLEPMAFNVGIAFGTAVGGSVVTGIGIGACGYVGAIFSLVACILVVLTRFFMKKHTYVAQAS